MVEYINETISMSSLVNMDVALQKMAETNLILLSISTATWIAIVTATISFWRNTHRHRRSKTNIIKDPGTDLIRSACRENKERDAVHLSSSDQPLGQRVLECQYMNDSPKKSRLTKRYENYAWDECRNNDDIYGVIDQECQGNKDRYEVIDQEGEEDKGRVDVTVLTRWNDMGVIRGDLGWYCCQDFTVFDGNVVRFWDSGCNLHFGN